MKLFLSSQGIPDSLREQFLALFAKPASGVKLAYITGAAEVYSDEERKGWYTEAIEDVRATGVHFTFLRLQDFAGNTAGLKQELEQFDGVWLSGGNAHYLRYQMKVSSFDELICSLLEHDFVYAGYSAGSIVAGPTLQFVDVDGEPHQ